VHPNHISVNMSDLFSKPETLLKLTSSILNTLLRALDNVDHETRRKIMEACGETCAHEKIYGPAIETAERIASEETDTQRIIERANNEIPWCGRWVQKGDTISSTCTTCGCPMVRNGLITATDTFCLCSTGWVKLIFTTLLGRPVQVELAQAMGRGDPRCRYIVIPK
jgi:predicted hydrocarbon binding protein